MSVPIFSSKLAANTKKALPIVIAAGAAVFSATSSFASDCYHHYNNNAWHGKGMAIVFCINSGGNVTPPHAMVSCEARYHSTGEKISDWRVHSNLDHGRQVFTDPGTPGREINDHIDIICTNSEGKTYTYYLHSNSWGDPGVCADNYYGGSECVDDHNPILKVAKTGGTGKITETSNSNGRVKGKINCATNCSSDQAHYQYYANKVVKLTAEADPGYRFVRWQGGCKDNTANPCEVTMNRDKTITAVFGRIAAPGANSLLLKSSR